jgi:geranylgeranyl diphosphate synthase type II
MVLKKTCWLATIHPIRTGALIGSRGGVDPDRFLRFGFLLGAAFQVQDDLLNLEGDPDDYGKEMDGDILEGKRTLMMIHLFEHVSVSELDELRAIFGRPRGERTPDDVRRVRALMDRYDSIDYARQAAHGLAGAARYEFQKSCGHLPDSPDRRFIAALPEWVIHRS